LRISYVFILPNQIIKIKIKGRGSICLSVVQFEIEDFDIKMAGNELLPAKVQGKGRKFINL